MNLDTNTIREIKELLSTILATSSEREALLFDAFGNENTLLGAIDYSLPANTFISKLVRVLADYGSDESGQPAIITFLSSMKSNFGSNKKSQIDTIINRLYPQPLNSEPNSRSIEFSVNAFDVFISYNSQDKSEVIPIAEKLQGKGIITWIDQWDISPGQSWQKLIGEQITQVLSAAVFIGKSGIGPWQREELEALLQQSIERDYFPVIPVLLPSAPSEPTVPILLANRNRVDFRSDSNPIDRLIAGIKGQSPRDLITPQ